MIEVRHLQKVYGASVAVEDLTFTVEPGKVTGFLGPNGAGKSTTMRMMIGLDRPTRGTVHIDGVSYRDIPTPMRRIGSLLEARTANPGRSGYHHLRWLAQTSGIPRTRVTEVLRLVGLEDAARKRAGTYSLGMAQRLGLAAALLGDPPVLLLDEPVNGLDPQGVRWIREFMRSLAEEGRTVFVSSHLMGEMALTADHLIVISNGRLLADTPMRDFVESHGSLEDGFLRLTGGVR